MASKDFYGYDPENHNRYIGVVVGYDSHLEPEVFYPPANTLPDAPPPYQAHQAVVADIANETWRVVPDYVGTQYWLPDGTTHEITALGDPLPAEASLTPPPPSAQEVITTGLKAIQVALQAHIDAQATALGWSSGNALMLYAGFANPFQAMAQSFATWEADIWHTADAYRDQVLAGTQALPTIEQAIAMIPPCPVTP